MARIMLSTMNDLHLKKRGGKRIPMPGVCPCCKARKIYREGVCNF